MFEKEAEEYLVNHFCKKVDLELIIGECDRGERVRCAGFETRKEMLIEFAKQKTEALREEVEDLKSDHEYNLGLMKGLNEKIAELNKANEWHYVKDGDLPKDTTSLYLVRVYSWNFSFSHLYKKYTTYIPTVCEWNGEYFTALDDMAYSNARNINSCVAWKEIVLPELKESE